MLFCFSERHQLKLLREMKKYQLDNKKSQSLTKRSHLMCSEKKPLFHKLVKSLNFASKEHNLRKAEGLKLYRNGIFFSSKNQLL